MHHASLRLLVDDIWLPELLQRLQEQKYLTNNSSPNLQISMFKFLTCCIPVWRLDFKLLLVFALIVITH